MTQNNMEVVELIEVLRDGVPRCGLHDDNTTELFDIEDANDAMYRAAEALTSAQEEIERLARELKCRDALIKDHLAKILHLENRVDTENARAEAAEKERDALQEHGVPSQNPSAALMNCVNECLRLAPLAGVYVGITISDAQSNTLGGKVRTVQRKGRRP